MQWGPISRCNIFAITFVLCKGVLKLKAVGSIIYFTTAWCSPRGAVKRYRERNWYHRKQSVLVHVPISDKYEHFYVVLCFSFGLVPFPCIVLKCFHFGHIYKESQGACPWTRPLCSTLFTPVLNLPRQHSVE